MVTRHLFLGFLGLFALQRLSELRLSQKNEIWMMEHGGVEHAPEHFKLIKLLHITWFPAMVYEVFILKRPFLPKLSGIALIVTAFGQILRYAAITALGHRWSVRIVTLPDSTHINTGIYRYIRHPNYAGVILEILSVPLLHSAYLTSIIWSIAHAFILAIRIRNEERALQEVYPDPKELLNKPRFIPELLKRRPMKINSSDRIFSGN